MVSHKTKREQKAVDDWNVRYCVGAIVTYESIKGDPKTARMTNTRSEAFVADSGVAVIFIDGQAGYVALDHIK